MKTSDRPVRALCRLLGLILALLATAPTLAEATPADPPLSLDGSPLSAEVIIQVAVGERQVIVDGAALARVQQAFDAVMAAARAGMPVYGLTTGVGWNKDKKAIQSSGALDAELLEASRSFNIGTLRAHAAGIGPPLSDEIVRAAMLIRLNVLLNGVGGVQPAVVEQYAAFLNCGMTPVVPGSGSVGQADILEAAHIGLAMVGEWRVHYRGKEVASADALRACGLRPVRLVGKDFLSILGNNTLVMAEALYAVRDARHWLDTEITVFALSLEGFNGNVAPFLESSVAARPVPGLREIAMRLRDELAGSYLWQRSPSRALQDPLSFRTMPIALANAWVAVRDAEDMVLFLANHSEDNPTVLLGGAVGPVAASGQEQAYSVPGVPGAAIVPTGNFDVLPLVSAVERASLALAHVSDSVAASVLRFENPALTGLPRFLTAPGNGGHGFGAVQKAVVSLNSEVRALANPVSLDGATLAGNIEDVINNSQLAVRRLQQITDRLYPLASLQLLHAAQAIDLRGAGPIGVGSGRLHAEYRKHVPFAAQDIILTDYLAAGEKMLRSTKD